MKNIIIFIISTLFSINAFSQVHTGYEIIEKNKEQMTTQNTQYENTMTLINKRGQKRIRGVKRFDVTDANNNKSTLVQFTYPADVKNTCLLSLEHEDKEDDRWLFLPALNSSRRIPSADISKSFMGTDFTYEDLAQDNIDEFDYLYKGDEEFNGIKCHIIEAKPKTEIKKKESGYSKRILYVSIQNFLVIHVKYFNKNDLLFKTFTGEDIRQIRDLNKWRFYKMTMNNIERNSKTVLEIKNYKINEDIKIDMFTKRYIESFGR